MNDLTKNINADTTDQQLSRTTQFVMLVVSADNSERQLRKTVEYDTYKKRKLKMPWLYVFFNIELESAKDVFEMFKYTRRDSNVGTTYGKVKDRYIDKEQPEAAYETTGSIRKSKDKFEFGKISSLIIDMDKFMVTSNSDDMSIEEKVREGRDSIPDLNSKRCYYQITSSQQENSKFLHARLILDLSSPVEQSMLKKWARYHKLKGYAVDDSIFDKSHIIFISDPLFLDKDKK